jgi:AhpD family alkylhydroperoxidase
MYDMQNLTKFESLSKLAPEAFKAFVAFDAAAVRDGAIPSKYKELMAIAVALTTQCPYCIELHTRKARTVGPRTRSWRRPRWSQPPSARAAP